MNHCKPSKLNIYALVFILAAEVSRFDNFNN